MELNWCRMPFSWVFSFANGASFSPVRCSPARVNCLSVGRLRLYKMEFFEVLVFSADIQHWILVEFVWNITLMDCFPEIIPCWLSLKFQCSAHLDISCKNLVLISAKLYISCKTLVKVSQWIFLQNVTRKLWRTLQKWYIF